MRCNALNQCFLMAPQSHVKTSPAYYPLYRFDPQDNMPLLSTLNIITKESRLSSPLNCALYFYSPFARSNSSFSSTRIIALALPCIFDTSKTLSDSPKYGLIVFSSLMLASSMLYFLPLYLFLTLRRCEFPGR